MKKFIKSLLVVALALTSAITASAQIEKGHRWAAQIGAGVSNITDIDSKNGFAFSFGTKYEYNFSSHFYANLADEFQRLGHKEAIFEKAISGTYVALPLHIGGRVYLGTSTSLFIEGGPQYNLGIFGSKLNLYGYEVNYFDRIKDSELGVGGKLGLEFMERFQIGIECYYGLTEALDSGHNICYGVSLAFWL